MFEDFQRLVFWDGPFLGSAKRHSTQDDLGYLETGLSKSWQGIRLGIPYFSCGGNPYRVYPMVPFFGVKTSSAKRLMLGFWIYCLVWKGDRIIWRDGNHLAKAFFISALIAHNKPEWVHSNLLTTWEYDWSFVEWLTKAWIQLANHCARTQVSQLEFDPLSRWLTQPTHLVLFWMERISRDN